jgi:hypothetical protein
MVVTRLLGAAALATSAHGQGNESGFESGWNGEVPKGKIHRVDPKFTS